MMIIALLSPHREDAAFSAGLTIGIWLNLGHRIEVVNCFTKINYSPFGDLTSGDGAIERSVMELRQQEDSSWNRLYARPVSLMGLELTDAPQRLYCSVAKVCNTAVDASDPAIARIRIELKRRTTDALVLQLGIGDHVDHLTTRTAAQDGLPSSLPLAFYEDLPIPRGRVRLREFGRVPTALSPNWKRVSRLTVQM